MDEKEDPFYLPPLWLALLGPLSTVLIPFLLTIVIGLYHNRPELFEWIWKLFR